MYLLRTCTYHALTMHSPCTYDVQAKIDEMEEELTRTEAVADEEVHCNSK